MLSRSAVLVIGSILAVAIGATAALHRPQPEGFGAALAVKSPPSVSSTPESSPTPSPPTPEAGKLTAAQTYQIYIISRCNGVPADANFREFPSLSPSAILGAVAAGQSIGLTGRQVRSDGELWYQAINLAPLYPADTEMAQNRLEVNQIGWIAGCFVEK